jgi:hypothetical protein
MTAQPAPIEKDPSEPDDTIAPDERERLIESLAHLLSAGRPFSDVLEEAKRLAGSPSAPTSNIEAEVKSVVIEVREPSFGTPVPEHKQETTSEAPAPFLGPLIYQEESALRSGRLTGRLAFWLLPTAIVALLALGGTVVFANLSLADAVSIVTALRAKSAIKPLDISPSPSSFAELNNSSPATKLPTRQMSAEQAAVLLARGDDLVKRADINSGRLFYERAADAGNAEAALRLGASYDPAFLERVGLKGVRGDAAQAAQWYKRARDLGSVTEAEALLKGLDPR